MHKKHFEWARKEVELKNNVKKRLTERKISDFALSEFEKRKQDYNNVERLLISLYEAYIKVLRVLFFTLVKQEITSAEQLLENTTFWSGLSHVIVRSNEQELLDFYFQFVAETLDEDIVPTLEYAKKMSDLPEYALYGLKADKKTKIAKRQIEKITLKQKSEKTNLEQEEMQNRLAIVIARAIFIDPS